MLTVAQAEIDELHWRLARTRWPVPWPVAAWEAGTDRTELKRLVEYWRTDFDWRANEAAINALPSHVTEVAGVPVHYLRYEGEGTDPLPIVLTHGWPSSFLEMAVLAPRLATPTLHGGDERDAFTVIVPSLPGFGLSPQRTTLPADEPTHEIWHRLMRDQHRPSDVFQRAVTPCSEHSVPLRGARLRSAWNPEQARSGSADPRSLLRSPDRRGVAL